MPRGETFNCSNVGAAAPAEDESPFGEVGRKRERLLAERVLRYHRRLRIRERKRRGGGHRLAVLAPGSRNPHEARAELPAARVTFVDGAERNRRHRPAIGALRAKPRHGYRLPAGARSFSKKTALQATCIPARSNSFVAPVRFDAATPSPLFCSPLPQRP